VQADPVQSPFRFLVFLTVIFWKIDNNIGILWCKNNTKMLCSNEN
jgi:hypothetical protein